MAGARRVIGRHAGLAARIAVGCVFLGFGPGKLIRHGAEASSFARYGIPFADAATYAVGVLEIVGGLALVLGLFVCPVALVLAVNLLVAIATAGRVDGGAVNLGLAPVLVVVLISLAVGACNDLGRPWTSPR